MGHRYGDSPTVIHSSGISRWASGANLYIDPLSEEKIWRKTGWLIITTDHGRKGSGWERSWRSIWSWAWKLGSSQMLKIPNGYFKNEKPAMVDILTTIARFMEIDIPITALKGIGWRTMIGELSIGQVKSRKIQEGRGDLWTWLPMESTGKVSIQLCQNGRVWTEERWITILKRRKPS